LLKVSFDDGAIQQIAPFGSPGGGIIAPPVNVPEHEMCIAWDSINGGLAGIATGGEQLEMAWKVDARPSMPPVVFPDTGELVINDFRYRDDQLIVGDVRSGDILSRVSTGSKVANGMFLTAGGNRDVFYCSTFAICRVQWH